jgi:hypothetical protein
MSAQAIVLGVDGKEGKTMTRRGFALGRQLAGGAALAALALGLSGDRTSAAGVPAPVYGQDPLEVLELKVRPNVIVVLDTSGSMTNNVPETFNTRSGDHPRSKLWQGKQVLQKIIQDNQDKVSFQYGTYTQNSFSFNNQAASTIGNRFQYVTSSMPSTELTVEGAVGDTFGRGIQSWQIIRPEWNRLYFGENGGTVCYAEIPNTPRFYNDGDDLAADLQAGMNSPTCTSGTSQNDYTVTYDGTTGIFTFARAAGSPRTFNIRWADSPQSIRGALGRRSTNNGSLSTNSVTSRSPYRLLYRDTGTGNSGGELGTRWTFTESIGGTDTTFYQLAAGRVWNGEVIRVEDDGTVCGMTFPTAAEMTKPPTLTLQLVADGCGGDTAGAAATFAFGGGSFSRSGDGCRGFRSKSSLIPCDLQTLPDGPAPTQFMQIGPYLEGELPFDSTGKPADLTTNGVAYTDPNYSVPDAKPDYVEHQDGSWQVESIDIGPAGKAAGYTPIANSLIDIKGTANAADTTCVLNAPPPPGKLDSLTIAATTGACPKRGFSQLWDNGQAGTTNMAGPPPWQLDPIKNHRDPKEKTIVLFVTDGDDTCGTRQDGNDDTNMDNNARRAALNAERLYMPIAAAEPASSVQTYVIGYGGAFTSGEPYRLNWIAWGGSGLGQNKTGQPDITQDGTRWTEGTTSIKTKRAQCTTCQDAFIAPDASTLAAQLQSIIDQGASDGDFTAQQSITESVFEYVDRVTFGAPPDVTRADARSPSTRYRGIVPTRFVSSFTLPGFMGQLKAYQDDGSGNSVEMWSAGDKLSTQVSNAMITCDSSTAGGGLGECVINQLHGGATDSTIAASGAKIKRRVYTTSRNGVYCGGPSSSATCTFDPATLMAGTSTERVTLWPPASGLLPSDYANPGPYDAAMGLPPDSPTTFPPSSTDKDCKTTSATPKTYDRCWLDVLRKDFKACLGNNLPTACATTNPVNTQMRAARREARDITLAFMAGAATIPEGAGIKRTNAGFGGAPASSILYKARPWILADSEMATAAVVTPPSLSEPEATPYVPEYQLYRDGTRDASGKNIDSSGSQVYQGFGLTQPDNDMTVASGAVDTRANVKPVMTVIYAPGNDMLHAFRAGPSCSPAFTSYSPLTANSSCSEGGGEELWGFVPYDQLEALRLRAANEPQGRANHVYMLTRGVRFADVFVPGAMTNVDIGGVTVPSLKGVWRRILYFGRGIGGKYVTALDVTAPGPYTARALSTTPPIPLWSRGNPDTQDGVVGTTPINGSTTDRDNYRTMGETWSMPTVVYTNKDKTNTRYVTTRRADGVDFVIFMGSGYGAAGEGTTHYALDALSGDVIAAVDVETVAANNGLTRTICSRDADGEPIETSSCSVMPNAIVANSVSFNRSAFESISAKVFNSNPHPWSFVSSRVYFGDIHGRLWKVLSEFPDVVIPAADLGANQPVGTAVALLGEGPKDSSIPNIFVTSGADRRASGPFRSFALLDQGTDTSTATTGSVTDDGVTTFPPVIKQLARTFDQGDPEADCGYTTEAVFRGTVQPTSAVECAAELEGASCNDNLLQRVVFGGTRLSLPNTKFAPPTPLACTGEYPCRSQFDSILYALDVKTGTPAYDLNASGDDAYRIFRDSRIAAISFQADPEPGRGGSRFVADEGLMKGVPKPPPPPGVPPTATTATANVIFVREPGHPAPSVQYGSTVCQ